MAKQHNFSTAESSKIDPNLSVHTAGTVDYITQLLSELETIATLSGLSSLSDDIHAVLVKQRVISSTA